MKTRRNHVHPVFQPIIDFIAPRAPVIPIRRDQQIECPKCHGVGGGLTRDGLEVDCSKCNGKGYVMGPADQPGEKP